MTKIWSKDYYEKLLNVNKKTEKSIKEYYEDIRNAQAKIEEIRLKCSHIQKEAVMYMFHLGYFQPSYVCKACDAYLGQANEEDSKLIWDEFNGNNL